MIQTGAAGEDLHPQRLQLVQVLQGGGALAGDGSAAVVEQQGPGQLLLLGQGEQEALQQHPAQGLAPLAHVVGGDDHHGVFGLFRGDGAQSVGGLRQLGPLLGGDHHPEAVFCQLFGLNGAALALGQAGEILHGDAVIHQGLHGAGALQALQGLEGLDHRDGAGVAHGVDLDHDRFLLIFIPE